MNGNILRFKNEDLFEEQQYIDLKNVMKNCHKSIVEAMDILAVVPSKRADYKKKYAEGKYKALIKTAGSQ